MLLSWIKRLFRKPRYRSLGWVNVYEDQRTGGSRWTSRPFKSKNNAIRGRQKNPKSLYLESIEIFTKEYGEQWNYECNVNKKRFTSAG